MHAELCSAKKRYRHAEDVSSACSFGYVVCVRVCAPRVLASSASLHSCHGEPTPRRVVADVNVTGRSESRELGVATTARAACGLTRKPRTGDCARPVAREVRVAFATVHAKNARNATGQCPEDFSARLCASSRSSTAVLSVTVMGCQLHRVMRMRARTRTPRVRLGTRAEQSQFVQRITSTKEVWKTRN